jgi:hypothetical protein
MSQVTRHMFAVQRFLEDIKMKNRLVCKLVWEFRTVVRPVRVRQQKGAIGFDFDSVWSGFIQRRDTASLPITTMTPSTSWRSGLNWCYSIARLTTGGRYCTERLAALVAYVDFWMRPLPFVLSLWITRRLCTHEALLEALSLSLSRKFNA